MLTFYMAIQTTSVAVGIGALVAFKVVSSEFYFHKPIIVHIELYLFYRFIHFIIVHMSVLTAENLIKVKAQQSFKKFHL